MDSQPLVEHIPSLRSYARALTSDAWAADDLAQDTLERACSKLRLWTIGSAASVASWPAQRAHACTVAKDAGHPIGSPGRPYGVGALRWYCCRSAIAFAAGWLVNGQLTLSHGTSLAKAPLTGPGLAGALASRKFVHAASVAHVAYAPEKRHPVEVVAAEQQHLVLWLSKRLNRPLKMPDRSSEGYWLVGGRLLPGHKGARAQFMFESAAGERVTLYIGALKAAESVGAQSRETEFRFTSAGPVPNFYSIDHGSGYAVAGKLPRDAGMKLATATYRQLF